MARTKFSLRRNSDVCVRLRRKAVSTCNVGRFCGLASGILCCPAENFRGSPFTAKTVTGFNAFERATSCGFASKGASDPAGRAGPDSPKLRSGE